MKIEFEVFTPNYEDRTVGPDHLSYVEAINRAYEKVEGLVIVEHDMYAPEWVKERFKEHIELAPDRVHVAPYLIYPKTTLQPYPIWAHREMLDPYNSDKGLAPFRPIRTGEPSCSNPALGFTYIPKPIWNWLYPEYKNAAWQILDAQLALALGRLGYRGIIHWDCLVLHDHA